MPRKRNKKREKADGQKWLVTFSDLVTLLLTFFVLILSMSTMDKNIITIAFSQFDEKLAFIPSRDAGKIPTRIKVTKDILTDPSEMFEKTQRIKDLLFPDKVLPSNINSSKLKENLDVLQKPEGVALVLSDKLLFAPGQSDLSPAARKLLDQVNILLSEMNAPVNISGHTDSTTGTDNYTLSAERATSVLNYFLEKGNEPSRFSISAYGPDKTRASNLTAQGRSLNRRVEILLKTQSYAKTYL